MARLLVDGQATGMDQYMADPVAILPPERTAVLLMHCSGPLCKSALLVKDPMTSAMSIVTLDQMIASNEFLVHRLIQLSYDLLIRVLIRLSYEPSHTSSHTTVSYV